MKKVISTLLAFILVFSAVPMSGIADLVKNIDFSFLSVKSTAASESDLGFLNKGDSYSVFYCNSNINGTLVIPETYKGKPVTGIENRAFGYENGLTSITIPDSITYIGVRAFTHCSNLTSITIPASIKCIGDWAFECCNNLTSVNVNSGNTEYTSVNGVLFNFNKTTLICYPAGKTDENYVVPESVTDIYSEAFYNCSKLKSITLPDGVTKINSSVFLVCSNLIDITIPNSVTSIGDSAFSGCDSLTSITIPDGVTSIGNSAFYGCDSLTSITIPDGVTSIGDNAFYDCSNLTNITIPDNVTNIGGDALSNCNSSLTIYGFFDSYAQTYANDNSIDFVAVDTLPRYGKFDYTNKVYFCNKDEISTAEDCLKFDLNYSYIVNKSNENGYVGTGSTVTVGENIYTVVITGDLDGDGVCDVLDALSAEKFANSQGDTPTTAQIYAANGDIAEEIDMSAYSNVVNKALLL